MRFYELSACSVTLGGAPAEGGFAEAQQTQAKRLRCGGGSGAKAARRSIAEIGGAGRRCVHREQIGRKRVQDGDDWWDEVPARLYGFQGSFHVGGAVWPSGGLFGQKLLDQIGETFG